MIAFILGTSEGREILSLINEYTDKIVVSTATKYGGELLKNFKILHINDKPLNEEEFKELFKKFNIKVLVDASHPYAQEVSKTSIKICKDMNIDYIRYEREGYFNKVSEAKNIIKINGYEDLKEALKNIEGNVLNTTGSNNVGNIMKLNLKNRVIHRILPSVQVLQKLIDSGVDIGDIIAIKGPFGYEINSGIIKEFKIKALITKDSGIEGGIKEKVEACINNGAKIIVINKPKINYGQAFNNVHRMIDAIVKKYKL